MAEDTQYSDELSAGFARELVDAMVRVGLLAFPNRAQDTEVFRAKVHNRIEAPLRAEMARLGEANDCLKDGAAAAEQEAKAYRDAIDAQPWATDEPIRVLLDRITKERKEARSTTAALRAETEELRANLTQAERSAVDYKQRLRAVIRIDCMHSAKDPKIFDIALRVDTRAARDCPELFEEMRRQFAEALQKELEGRR